MRRRFILATLVLGALSAMAFAQSQSVVTLPLKPPPAKTEKAKPKADGTETVAVAPVAQKPALTPQAIIEIPPPDFTAEPLFPNGVPIDTETVPSPELEVIDAEEKPAAEPPPLPRPKPEAPAAVKQDEPAPPAAAPPPKPTEVLRAAPQPAPLAKEVTAPTSVAVPRAAPQPAPLAKEATASTSEKRPLRRGEMEPIDDYRPSSVVVDTKALDRSLMPGNDKATKIPSPQPKPGAPEPKAEKKTRGEMMPVDDIPGGKSYKAPRGQATTFRCFVRDVMAFYDRTHIRCYNKAKNKLNFFAVDTGQPISEALVAKGLAAMKSGKPATVTFAPEADLNPSNCAAANCRRLIDIQN